MSTLKLTGAFGLCCAVLTAACADPSGSLPNSPTAITSSRASGQASTVSSSASSVAGGAGNEPSTAYGNGNGNGNGGPKPNGGGNGNGNGNGSGGNGNGGGGNGNGHGNQPAPAPSPVPPTSKKVELEGLISAIAGHVLTVTGQNVLVPPTVVVHHGSHLFEFADLVVGDRVHVRAQLVDGALVASDLKLQNPGDGEEETTEIPDGTELSVEGFVSLLSAGVCPVKTFNVGAQEVATDAATVFAGGICTAMVNGGHVLVVGVVQSGVLVAMQVQVF
jgi:hypothetical protein